MICARRWLALCAHTGHYALVIPEVRPPERKFAAMLASLVIFLVVSAIVVLFVGASWVSIVFFLGAIVLAFELGYLANDILRSEDPPRWLRKSRYLIHPDFRPEKHSSSGPE
jgi:pilus assembly protein TadC